MYKENPGQILVSEALECRMVILLMKQLSWLLCVPMYLEVNSHYS